MRPKRAQLSQGVKYAVHMCRLHGGVLQQPVREGQAAYQRCVAEAAWPPKSGSWAGGQLCRIQQGHRAERATRGGAVAAQVRP